MKAEPDIMLITDFFYLLEIMEDCFCIREIRKTVSYIRMGETRKEGGKNAKSTNAVLPEKL